jgi:predicted Fe-S protein YdhL (DUF1289 family)
VNALEALAELGLMARSLEHPVPSPCISICRMNADSGLCQGCFRTLDEIIAWGSSSEPDKRIVWRLIAQRAGL